MARQLVFPPKTDEQQGIIIESTENVGSCFCFEVTDHQFILEGDLPSIP